MKARNFYGLLALCAGAAVVSPQVVKAQNVVVEDESVSVTEFTCDPSTKYFSNWRNNWFIQIGAGINQPFVEKGIGGATSGQHNVNHHNMTTVYNFGFGRWFSPYLGFRFNALGGATHWNTPTIVEPTNGWTRAKHANLNLDLMWDMCNSIAGVNPNRVFSIIPYVGIGGDYQWDIRDAAGGPAAAANIHRDHSGQMKNSSWTLPVSAGVQFRLRLCKYVDFFGEMRSNFYGDNWNGTADGRPIEANVSVYGGFNFNIGGRTWEKYNECAALSQIASLNNEVNNLRGEVLAGAATIASLESQLPCPDAKTVTKTVTKTVQKDCVNAPLMTTVRFTIDSDVISPEEQVNVYNMAQWLKDNPDQNVIIVGYADKDTGTAEYNLDLSKRRADAVANDLINNYGIDKDRLTVKYDGSNVQPYGVNNWNRIVIFTQE